VSPGLAVKLVDSTERKPPPEWTFPLLVLDTPVTNVLPLAGDQTLPPVPAFHASVHVCELLLEA
jgi:hypothetical protein